MKLLKKLCIVTALIPLVGCDCLTRRSMEATPSPLVVASCPELTLLSDDSFGATTSKLVEVAGIYYGCRAAAGVR